MGIQQEHTHLATRRCVLCAETKRLLVESHLLVRLPHRLLELRPLCIPLCIRLKCLRVQMRGLLLDNHLHA